MAAEITESVVLSGKTVGSIIDCALGDLEKAMIAIANKSDLRAERSFLALKTFSMLTSLKWAFVEDLTLPYEGATDGVQATLSKIKKLIPTIISGHPSELHQAAQKVEEIIDFLYLLSPKIPVITHIDPQFIAVGAQNRLVLVNFIGRFLDGNRLDCAQFTLNDKTYAPISSCPKKIQFKIDLPSNFPKLHQFTYISGTLKIFYRTGIFSWKAATYKTRLGLMPNCPGQIQVLTNDNNTCVVDAGKWGTSVRLPPPKDSINSITFISFDGKQVPLKAGDNESHPHIAEVMTTKLEGFISIRTTDAECVQPLINKPRVVVTQKDEAKK